MTKIELLNVRRLSVIVLSKLVAKGVDVVHFCTYREIPEIHSRYEAIFEHGDQVGNSVGTARVGYRGDAVKVKLSQSVDGDESITCRRQLMNR